MITDGPYLESKEHIGGFWIIEVPDLAYSCVGLIHPGFTRPVGGGPAPT